MADIAPPEVPAVVFSKPDKSTFGGKRYKRPRVSVTTIAEAMITAKGDRAAAAKMLGMSHNHLNNRISTTAELRARFSKKAAELRIRLDLDAMEANGQKTPDQVDIIGKQLEELAVGQGRIAQIALNRLVEIQERIRKGNEAKQLLNIPPTDLTADEVKLLQRWKFSTNAVGDPVEEKLLLAQEQAMMQEYSRANESCSGVAHKKAQTETLLRKLGSQKNRPRQMTALPKGASPVSSITNISGSQVVISAPTPKPNE